VTPPPQQKHSDDLFIITRDELDRCCNQMSISGYKVSANYVEAMVLSRPHTSTPQCPHWGINRIVPNDDNGEYSGFVDSWECCKPNNDTTIRKAERERVLLSLLERIEDRKIEKWGESERDAIFRSIETMRSKP
jgi:hypothetical protein